MFSRNKIFFKRGADMARGKVQFKVGVVDNGTNKRNKNSVKAGDAHGDEHRQLGVKDSGHIKRKK